MSLPSSEMEISSEEIEFMKFSWITSLPLSVEGLESCNFSFLFAEWKLKLRYTGSVYEISVHKMTSMGESHYFEVMTCTEHDEEDCKIRFCQTATVKREFACIWAVDERSVLRTIPQLKRSRVFTIICMFSPLSPDVLQKDISKKQARKHALEFPTDLCGLSFDLGKLLEEGVMTDVEFECEGKTVPAHKAVLAARSAVFSDMFRENKDESSPVDVPDLDIEVFQLLLKYAYCGKIEDVHKRVIPKLYRAADKYAVLGLKKACSYWMKRMDNA